jgi:hypothetical protein
MPAAVERLRERQVSGLRQLDERLREREVPHHRAASRMLRLYAWHQARIAALLDTEAQVASCMSGTLTRTLRCLDPSCGHTWQIPWWCERPMLCPRCRSRDQSRRRAAVSDQVMAALDGAPMTHRARMLTITVPHVGDVEERLALAFAVRSLVVGDLRRWGRATWRGRRWVDHWWSSMEQTSGDDGLGHPHWHTIVVSGYLPEPVVATILGSALLRAAPSHLRERVDAALHREPLAQAIDWLDEHCAVGSARTRVRARSIALLLTHARIPWTIERTTDADTTRPRPPRRRDDESIEHYVARRAEWARSAADGGAAVTVRHRALGRVLADYESGWAPGPWRSTAEWLASDSGADVLTMIASAAHLRYGVCSVDMRSDRSPTESVNELIKYTIKDQGDDAASPALIARTYLWCRGRRTYQSSMGSSLPRERGDGCPACSGTWIRAERAGTHTLDDVRRVLGRGAGYMFGVAPEPPARNEHDVRERLGREPLSWAPQRYHAAWRHRQRQHERRAAAQQLVLGDLIARQHRADTMRC